MGRPSHYKKQEKETAQLLEVKLEYMLHNLRAGELLYCLVPVMCEIQQQSKQQNLISATTSNSFAEKTAATQHKNVPFGDDTSNSR
jgi:hypothetical protein